MPKFRIVTPAGASFSTAGGGYAHEMEALEGLDAEIVECPATQEGFIAAARDADAVYAKGMKFNAQMIQALDKCRLIALGTVGVDYVDVAAATEKGIPVTNCPDTFIEEVADHAMMLLLATHRRAIEQDRMVREGRWTEGRPQLLKVPRLMGQTLGFIAFGRVARAVAERARPFGLRMLAHDPFLDELNISALGVEPASLSEVLSRSDFISMHLPATPEAVGFLKEQHFRQMKPNAIFINTGRGTDGQRAGADQGAAGEVDRRRRARRAASRAGQARQPASEDAARHSVAAQRLGLVPLRSRRASAASARSSPSCSRAAGRCRASTRRCCRPAACAAGSRSPCSAARMPEAKLIYSAGHVGWADGAKGKRCADSSPHRVEDAPSARWGEGTLRHAPFRHRGSAQPLIG